MKKDKILISDANHGGLTLIKEYSKYTDHTLYFYDTYNKLTRAKKRKLEREYNVTFLEKDYVKENIDEFTTISPVHMPDMFRCDYTHHEFTGYLLKKHKAEYGWDFSVIEVTGVKGKTTTTFLLANILRNYNTLILSSDSLTYNSPEGSKVLSRDLSITPASIITSLNIARDNNLLDKINYFICEVSLGITSNCDVGVLTNIIEDYPVANGKRSASIAKRSVFNSRYVVCDKNTLDTYYGDINNRNITTVSLNDKNSNVYASRIDYLIDKTSVEVNYNNEVFSISTFAHSDFYINNILLAVAVALVLKIGKKEIIENMNDTKALDGRGSYTRVGDKLVFEDINSGLNTSSIKKCIDNISRYSDSFTVILGGDYGITCEEIDEKSLCRYIGSIQGKKIILTGELGYNLNKKLADDYEYYENLKDAFSNATCSSQDIIQIIYRSEYNLKRDYIDYKRV